MGGFKPWQTSVAAGRTACLRVGSYPPRPAAGSILSTTVHYCMRVPCAVLIAALSWSGSASAEPLPIAAERQIVHTCIDHAAGALEVSPLVLRLLYSLESGRVGHVSHWGEGNFDIGPMQINNWWLRRLSAAGITLEELRDNACTNVFVGAWIFKHELERAGDVALAIARYHSPTPAHQRRYLDRATRHLDQMLRTQGRPVATADAPRSEPASAAPRAAATPDRPRLRSIAATTAAATIQSPAAGASAPQ